MIRGLWTVTTAAAAAMILLMASGAMSATIAVAPLEDASPGDNADTAQGVTDLVAGTLASRLHVVAREQLNAVLVEQGIAAKGLADPQTAVKVGRLVGADVVLTGSVIRTDDSLTLAVQVVRVRGGDVLHGITVAGTPDKLLDTALRLADKCAEALQVEPAVVDAREVNAAELTAEKHFLLALGYYHAGNYDRAIMNCLKVIQLNPNDERARLRLAESFLAAGEGEQARITLDRTLQLFPETRHVRRARGLLNRISPREIQAVAKTQVQVSLPDTWPADTDINFELAWDGQPARRDRVQAVNGVVVIDMPGARVPLSLSLTLSVEGRDPTTRGIRLWPVSRGIRQPEDRNLVVVDPKQKVGRLLEDVRHKRYSSCRSIPGSETRMVVVSDGTLAITADQARSLTEYVTSGGQLAILGRVPNGMEIAGLRQTVVQWPASFAWTPARNAAAWSYIPAVDMIAAFAHEAESPAVAGGEGWLVTAEREISVVSAATVGKGHVMWICWPFDSDAGDPRFARLLALAVEDAGHMADR